MLGLKISWESCKGARTTSLQESENAEGEAKERKDFQRTLEIIAKRSIQVFDYLHSRIKLVGLQA